MPKSIWSCDCKKRRKESKRLVAVNDPTGNTQYPDNRISNTKYTVWSFLPKNIIEQFMRFMNLYFLLVAILQLFPTITPVNPITSWFPLAFIFSLTAAKEAADDYFRYKADKKANERPYYVIRHGVKMSIPSCDISVGDLVFMDNNNEAPCDLVILKTSDETGAAYIQTANLDGETDYKSRQAVSRTQNMSNEELYRVQGLIECAGPNGEIYKFDSRMIMAEDSHALMTGNQSRDSFSAGSEGSNNYSLKDLPHHHYISLSVNNVILQATHLRNTDWLIGVAVYTGNDTKIGQNKSHPPIKWTQMDRFVNKLVAFVFIFQLLIVIVLGVLGNVWSVYFTSEHWYLDHFSGVTYWWSWIVVPLRFVLLLSLMIPISLKVSMDLVKYAYAMFIGWDLEFFDEETSVRARAANSAISEDLGQVEYIFCDKTGTLTDNVMRFAKCTIGATTYGHNLETGNALYDSKLRQRIVERQEDVMLFFKLLTLCNTVVPAHNEDELAWKSSSPDEEAMVNAAAHFNIVFRRRHLSNLELNVCGETEHYELLNTLEFSSDRKRMSVMLRRIHNKRSSAQMKGDADEVLLFIKGADDKILPLIHNKEDVEMATTQVDMFAKLGLRTMCVAYKRMSLREYEDWSNIFQEANTSLEDRDIKLATCYAEVENNLTFVGVTAIEDKLQDAVPSSIAMLQQAGIKVWMITGDKAETAIQIAKQTNLMVESPNNQNLLIIEGNNSMEVGDVINQALERVLYTENGEFSLLIDGKVLPFALGDNKQNFLSVVTRCKSVICCRTTPHQKAQIVELIKKGTKKVTLAIGDGGNDVSMIQMAHVGVGIHGKEGLQAARASDYSFAKFKFLPRLLFVHGRQSYRRTAFVTLYCFHKSLFIAFIQVFFALYSGYSGHTFFNTIALVSYNVVFTGFPIVFYSLDQDVSNATLMKNPKLYLESQRASFLNFKVFIYWFVRSILQAAAVFWITIDWFGEWMDQEELSMVAYTACVIIQTLTILSESHYVTFINHLVIHGTLALYFGSMAVLNYWRHSSFYGTMFRLYESPEFWLAQALITVVAMAPVMFIKAIKFNYMPDYYQIIQKLERTPNSPYYLGAAQIDTKTNNFVEEDKSPLLNEGSHHYSLIL